MISFNCDNCGVAIDEYKKRHIWFKSCYFDTNQCFQLDLCDKCYARFVKHIRRTVTMYQKVGRQ